MNQDFFNLYNKIKSTVNKSENILLITHQNPDGDAYGSISSFSSYLESLNKNYSTYFYGICEHEKKFSLIKNRILNSEDIFLQKFDLIVFFDAGDILHCKLEEDRIKSIILASIINIDHHKTNKFFGEINFVDSDMASTTEGLTNYFKYINFPLNKRIATFLLLGIVSDTQNFSNSSSSASAFLSASFLLSKGADFSRILSLGSNLLSGPEIKQEGEIWSEIKKNNKHNIAYAVISKYKRREFLDKKLLDNLSNKFNLINDISLGFILKEEEEIIRVSMRTTYSGVDLGSLAKFLGGGGHKKAAGFSINGKLMSVEGGGKKII